MKIETKIKEVKRISELNLQEEEFFKKQYGQIMYDNHIKHDNLVEIQVTKIENIVPFLETSSDRMKEAQTRNKNHFFHYI